MEESRNISGDKECRLAKFPGGIDRAPFLHICVRSTPKRLVYTEILNTQPFPLLGSDRLPTCGLLAYMRISDCSRFVGNRYLVWFWFTWKSMEALSENSPFSKNKQTNKQHPPRLLNNKQRQPQVRVHAPCAVQIPRCTLATLWKRIFTLKSFKKCLVHDLLTTFSLQNFIVDWAWFWSYCWW